LGALGPLLALQPLLALRTTGHDLDHRSGHDRKAINRRRSKGVRRTKWWKRGEARAQRLGLLDGNRVPTFQWAQWTGSGVSRTANGWTPENDHEWP
jgi:hypothetical protein